jgi:hypothetical protein
MKLIDLFEAVGSVEMLVLRQALDKMFTPLELFTVATTHFRERLEEGGREGGTLVETLIEVFQRVNTKYAGKLKQLMDTHKNVEIVIKDRKTRTNIVCAFDFSTKHPRSHKYTLTLITVMHKDPSKFHVGGTPVTLIV